MMEESSRMELADNENDSKIESENVQFNSNISPFIPKEEMNLDFVWNDYLEETGATAAPPTSFLHVEQSLESGFKEGMKLEIPNRHDGDTYWVASIVVTCGPLLRLRYEGCCDRAAEFWCDVGSSEMHVLGWGEKNKKILEPPRDLNCEVPAALFKDAISVPQSLLEARGATPVDQLKQGMRVEVEDEDYRQQVHLATILRNIGGRLLLRYDDSVDSFWLFYLSYRIHAVGWAKENEKEVVANVADPAMLDCDADRAAVPQQIFQIQETVRTHGLRAGLALETLNPFCPDQLCAAVVTKVIDEYYFEITVDVSPSAPQPATAGPKATVCYADSPFILPVGWSRARSLPFALPDGYSKDADFDWALYLAERKVQAAPSELFNLTVPDHGFEVGMMLEAVDPSERAQICAATITKVADHLLWVRLENNSHSTRIVHVKSHEIFPVGWCESNGYPLIAAVAKGRFRVAMNKAPMVTRSMRKLTDRASGKAWCPSIYFNHKCFSGPYLSKGRIAELPRQVGPGSVILVMKEVLSLIVNVAYQPSRVLSELSARGPPSPGMQHQVLKAKYKGKSYKAMVEIVRSSDKVAEFCRSICRKLECCPYLFGPTFVGEDCPDNCSSLTKTKYSVRAPCSRRRKRMARHSSHLKKPGESCKGSAEVIASQTAQPQEACQDEKAVEDVPVVKKRKYVHKIHPKLEIVTRKAKLPNYALQLRRRRRSKKPQEEAQGVGDNAIHKAIQVALPLFEIVKLEKSPLLWSVDEVVRYMKNTDCAHLARLLKDQEIDGQALLLLTLPTVQEHLELKLGPATMLCQHIEKIKLAFFANFAN